MDGTLTPTYLTVNDKGLHDKGFTTKGSDDPRRIKDEGAKQGRSGVAR